MLKIRRIKLLLTIVIAVFFLSIEDSLAKVDVVTSLPELASIAQEVGGEKVKVFSLAKGYQDPHFVDPKPTFILKLNRADILIYNGLNLEIGWLPSLITGSRNSNITSTDADGHLNVSTFISDILEVPNKKIDRSQGDIHPGGNPHYLLDPRNGIIVAKGIAERLINIDPENASYYDDNLNNFVNKLSLGVKRWDAKLKPFMGTKIVTYHKVWTYFANWAGFNQVGFIEPKPGIPPSPSHVAKLIKKMEDLNVKLIIASNYYPTKTASVIAQKANANLLILPVQVGGEEGINTYYDLFDYLVNELTNVLGKEGS